MTTKRTRKLPEPPEIALTPLAVVTDKNQLTLAEGILTNFPGVDCFEVTVEDGRMVLTPFEDTTIEGVWAIIDALGITEEDVADAVKWARGRWMW
ncbi:MAG: AbrB/MazE/SpoVT family DNA-binding domain-containing protein [Chloroflexi bacterium]|nr:AbrB/MazE/SpoVT family DNA-binding domain-containing protein [Chloroflexota bacterium]